MYAGHVGIALALRGTPGAPPLALLVLAAQGPDWVELALNVVGISWVNPAWAPHALQWIALGSVVAAAVALSLGGPPGWAGRARAAAVSAAAYASHWPADVLTGIKPTIPSGPLVGLGWYGRPSLDLAVEACVVLVGWWLWRRSLPPSRGGGPLAWALLAALLALQLGGDVVLAGGGWLG